MAPITVTETELEHPLRTNDWLESKLTHRSKETYQNGSTTKTLTVDTYDKMLRPEPSFLKPIRRLEKKIGFTTPLRWMNLLPIIGIHIVAVVWGLHFLFSGKPVHWATAVFGYLVGQLAGFGVTAGVHRMWCHRSYKAKLPLQWILIICYSIAGQNTIYEWVRDHRVHHKFSETTADPHDANRGFFYAHVGWLMMKKHPDVVEKGSKLDLSDIVNDPLIQFHTKYFWVFKIAFCWVIPSIIPPLVWGETWELSILSQCVLRYVASLNFTWSVNSFAHLWGNKPYDKNIMPVENWGVSAVALGEGWHNYHHTFPFDYKASELGMSLNLTTTILNYFAKIGWAYDMKEASPSLVRSVAEARGDPEHRHHHHH
ncbi:acyl-CoA Delta-9 desaturase-like isoform X2 [Anticarsia gemmatalis]|uniref:acyl-CoA Delta-9 desaturase-like isoform X2 n=1 Tax=Anticarsia gemmatalis TaxID=129554 RepID=UPI003F75CF14